MSGLATSKCKIIGLHDASVTVGHPQKARFQHLCTPVKGDLLTMGGMARDGTSDAFVLVMKGGHRPSTADPVLGIWARTTYDLINRSNPVLLWSDPSAAKSEGDPRATDRDPSLLDPTSNSRNFATLGSRPCIYFVRMNPDNRPYDRQPLRVPIRITVAAP